VSLPSTDFSLFLAAALIVAAVPGPGIFYVAARTLSEGRRASLRRSALRSEGLCM
jgi:threonine/homoserine/homoserine lactone efflux protein